MPRGVPNKPTTTRGKQGNRTSSSEPKEGMTGGTTTAIMEAEPLTEEIGQMVNGPSAQWEGAPYFDPTLNFLHYRWEQVDLDRMRALDKIDKLETHVQSCTREMTTIAELLKKEFENREVINPNTGERLTEPRESYA